MKKYAVKESFLTLQGEGRRSGAKSVFLRLAGCNLWNGLPEDRAKGAGACARWCDTDFAKGTPMTKEEIVLRLDTLWPPLPGKPPRWVVITGGEPLLQIDQALVTALHQAGWSIACETNGTLDNPVAEYLDWVTVSPKIGGELKLGRANEVKVVLPGDAERPWTDAALLHLRTRIKAVEWYVQPQDPILPQSIGATHLHGLAPDLGAQYRRNVSRCVTFCLANPAWHVSLQSHKFFGMP